MSWKIYACVLSYCAKDENVVMLIESDKVLYFIGGANGSGKSALAKKLFGEHPTIQSVNADDIAYDVGCPPTSAIIFTNVQNQISKALSANASFIYETTLSSKFDMGLIKRVKAAGYRIEFIYVTVSTPDKNINRVADRVKKKGHNVRQGDILRRRPKSFSHFDPVCAQVNHWQLYDNTEEGALHKLIAEGSPKEWGGKDVTIFNPGMYFGFMQYKQAEVVAYAAEVKRARAAREAKARLSQSK